MSQIGSKRIYVLFFTFNALAFTALYFYKNLNDINAIITGGIISAILIAVTLTISTANYGDRYLFPIVSMLISIGCILLYRIKYELVSKQILWIMVGIIIFILSSFIYMKLFDHWVKLSKFYYIASILLFILTLAIGKVINGSKNWIIIGGQSFQPSELIKIFFVLFLASQTHFVKDSIKINLTKFNLGEKVVSRTYVIMAAVYVMMGFLVLQKDWGTILELFLVYSIMTYVFEKNYHIVLLNTFLAVFGAVGGYFMTSHIKVRVEIWLNPWADPTGKGFQVAQSLYAMAAGKFFGTGIGNGNIESIPFVESDFIFAAIFEELGMFGACSVVMLFLILVYRGIKISLSIKDSFQKRVILGITAMIAVQTFIIVGGVTKMIPLTGVTLPFISYGGSSLTTSFLSLGILQAVSQKTRIKEDDLK